MLNKDKRSLILSLVIGDGCLHYIRNNGKEYGGLTIDHGIEQADYQAWKASLLSEILGRNIKVRTGHRGKSVQLSVCMKRFRAWRKFCYPNGKKDRSKILRFIRHPEFALAVWLADDGYCERSKNCGALRIFTCSSSMDTHEDILRWFKTNFDVEARIKMQKSWNGKHYPFIKFNQADSFKLWGLVREFVLQFKSMQHKFKHIEQVFQSKGLQRLPSQSNLTG